MINQTRRESASKSTSKSASIDNCQWIDFINFEWRKQTTISHFTQPNYYRNQRWEYSSKRTTTMSNDNSSYHDCIFLPFLGSDSVLRIMFRCICADAECKQRSSSFKALGDVRGTFITMPDYNPISNYTNATERKKSKLTRYKKHLGLNKTIAEIASNDNRSKQTDISNRTRSTSESLPKRSKRYIAWHHFHPAAIHYSLSIKNKYNINVLLPKEFVVGTIQIDGNSNGYKSADLVEHGDARAYLMVPSYNKGKTKDDIVKVA